MKDVKITKEDLIILHSDAVKQMQDLSQNFCNLYDDKIQRAYCFLIAFEFLLNRKGIKLDISKMIHDSEDFFIKGDKK